MTTESRTDAAERIVEGWLGADYSNVQRIDQKLTGHDKTVFRAALITIASHGVAEGERRKEAQNRDPLTGKVPTIPAVHSRIGNLHIHHIDGI